MARVSVLKPVAVACRPSRTSWLGEANTAWPADSVKSRSASGLAAGAGAGAERAPAHARGSRTSGPRLESRLGDRVQCKQVADATCPVPPATHAQYCTRARSQQPRVAWQCGWPCWSSAAPPTADPCHVAHIHRAASRYAVRTRQPPTLQAHSAEQKGAPPQAHPLAAKSLVAFGNVKCTGTPSQQLVQSAPYRHRRVLHRTRYNGEGQQCCAQHCQRTHRADHDRPLVPLAGQSAGAER